MRNFTPKQKELLEQLGRTDPALSVAWDDVRGVASSIRGRFPTGKDQRPKPEKMLESFLAEFGELFGLREPARQIKLLRSRKDDLQWTHLAYFQVWNLSRDCGGHKGSIEVYNSKLAAHFLPDGTLREVQSSCWRDIDVEEDAQIGPKDIKETLKRALTGAPGFRELEGQMKKRKEKDFPIMQAPRLVVYPWKGGFRLVYTTYAYGPIEEKDRAGKLTGRLKIEFGQLFVDAGTGEQILFAPTKTCVDTPDTGSGLGSTPLGGPFTSRNLNIVHDSAIPRSRLRDTTHNREIITYDAAGNSTWIDPGLSAQLEGGTVPVSEDTNKNWDRVAADTTDAERTSSQQPEVDEHFYCRDLYEWYDTLAGGRDGWDNNNYTAPLVPNQAIRVVAHTYDTWPGTSRSVNAYSQRELVSGHWVSYLAFFDGDPTQTCTTANDRAFDYLSGSPFVVAHEYQHQITDFNFEDGGGNPGLTYDDWFAAIHEGMSDVFGGLYSETWIPGPEFSSVGMVFRNVAYPRDPNSWVNMGGVYPCGVGGSHKDHFADRNTVDPLGARYENGIILAHCAYLTGQGGVHQRTSRTPALIPVYSLGRDTIGTTSFLKAARIWYRAYTYYFSTHGALTGIPANDESTFRTLRNANVSAAEDIYGTNSPEHLNTSLGWYAVGLHPTAAPYGPDVTFLRWGADWWMSRPYVGISSPDWSSVDLYIKNGTSASGWNAQVNVLDSSSVPTDFENDVYCRVRNVGDQQADNIVVTFEYAKAGTAPVVWLPIEDKNGVVQTLNVGSLAAGQSNFPDADQESPPTSARIKWAIPPLAAGEVVDHFCIRAAVTSSNDVNPHNNWVQSNISYGAYTPLAGFGMAFTVGNPTKKTIPLQLQVQASLPRGWEIKIPGLEQIKQLKRNEERTLEVKINMKEGADRQLEPPFDGDVWGDLFGSISAPVTGTLTATTYDGNRLEGRFAGSVEELGAVVGAFDGRIDVKTGEIKGRIKGSFQCGGSGRSDRTCIGIKGCLRPWRRVNISQWLEGAPLGGLTLQVQIPMNSGRCQMKLPPTDTRVTAPKKTKGKTG